MIDQERDIRIEKIVDEVRGKIKHLTLLKISGKYELTVEINVTQGAIGNVYVRNNAREKLSLD